MATKFVFRPTQAYCDEVREDGRPEVVDFVGMPITRIRLETETTYEVTVDEGCEFAGVTIDMIRME